MSEWKKKSGGEAGQGGSRTDPTDQADRTDQSDRTEKPKRQERLRPSGGYRKLRSFQTTSVIYDGTVSFCDRFMDKRSRTVDQMVQAARSGRQNIAEGSRASAASSQTELRLINVARASLKAARAGGFGQWGGPEDSGLPEVRRAHGPADSPKGRQRRVAILGLLRLSQVQRDSSVGGRGLI